MKLSKKAFSLAKPAFSLTVLLKLTYVFILQGNLSQW